MTRSRYLLLILFLFNLGAVASALSSEPANSVQEKALNAPNSVTIRVRMEGPYTAQVPLQVVCYFKYTPEGSKRMSGAPVELDKRLGGVIASLRSRGDFSGDELETLLITPPKDSIPAKGLLLVGLGAEESLSLNLMERVGRVALREASRLGTNRVAFAPLIRDQGNSKLPTGDVAGAVVRGVLLAYDTEKRLQREGLAKEFTLKDWNQEAGSSYFDDTATGIDKAIRQAKTDLDSRSTTAYSSQNK